MLDDLILIALLLSAYLYWFNGQRVKEVALQAVRANCLNLEVQMLDEYVALNSIRLKRDKTGNMRLRRTFLFEFSSTGNDLANGAWNVRSHYKADRAINISALQQMTLLVRLTVYTSLAFVSLFYFMKNWYKDATNVE